MLPRPQAFFAAPRPGPLAERLCLWTAPGEMPARALVVYVHPLAEEMNKSRRMVARQARLLAGAGCAVLQMDLLGCGDSAGDFGDATWAAWVDDVVDACAIAAEHHRQAWPRDPAPPLWLWGLRSGCLLAAQAAERIDAARRFLFWQPTPNGRAVLQGFLRLQRAAAMLGKATPAPDSGPGDGPQEIAGYRLHPGLVSGLAAARLAPPAHAQRLEWLEVSSQPDDPASPATQQALKVWQDAGVAVRRHSVPGPAFWQTTEIEEAPALLAATPACVQAPDAQAAPTVPPSAVEA